MLAGFFERWTRPGAVRNASARRPGPPGSSLAVNPLAPSATWMFTPPNLEQPTNSISVYLKERLSPETRQDLPQQATSKTVVPSLRTNLVNDFNKVVQGPAIYEEQRFSGVSLRIATKNLLERNPQFKE